jgi:hypothetical protein
VSITKALPFPKRSLAVEKPQIIQVAGKKTDALTSEETHRIAKTFEITDALR